MTHINNRNGIKSHNFSFRKQIIQSYLNAWLYTSVVVIFLICAKPDPWHLSEVGSPADYKGMSVALH